MRDKPVHSADHAIDSLHARSTTGAPELLISTSASVLAVFAATFLVGTGLVVLLLRLRMGNYELESLAIFQSLFVFLDYWPAVAGVVISALGLLRPVQSASLHLVEAIGRRPYLTAAVTLLLLGLGARYAYHAHPLSMDEYSPYFQSRAFAAGHLTGRFPPDLLDWLVPVGFQNVFLVVSRETGQVVSAYMPGFALLLTPFMALGLPWLCNPVLGAASVLVVHRLAMQLFGAPRLAGLAMLLAIASGAFSVNAMSFYSMTAHALANAVFALLLLAPTVRRCVLAGVVGSVALVLHNPLPHTLFALPWLIWLAIRPDRVRNMAAIIAGYVPLFLLLGAGWTLFSAGIQGAATAANATGPVGGGFVEHWMTGLATFLSVPSVDLLVSRGVGLAKLWIWSVPVLLAAAAAGAWVRRTDHRIRLLTWSCVATLAGFLFVVFSQGHGWGFRYFHSAWLCLPLLAVAATRTSVLGQKSEPHTLFSYMAAVATLALMVPTPLHVWQVHGFVARHLQQVPTSDTGTPEVVIVNPVTGYYARDLVQNDPFLRDPVTRMVTHGRASDEEMMAQHYQGLTRLSRSYKGEVWGTGATE